MERERERERKKEHDPFMRAMERERKRNQNAECGHLREHQGLSKRTFRFGNSGRLCSC